jgi:glycosyltransferase involved in cell wall biosynthesis
MPDLLYVANHRLPTEKAHGLQIVQMCEALAGTGYDLTLVAPRRFNTRAMRAVGSLWEHYGVERNFTLHRRWCVDLFPLFPRYHVAFFTQTLTYLLALLLWPRFWRADMLYTRDAFIGAVIALARPRARLVYEPHGIHRSRIGQRLMRFLVRRAYNVPITAHMADRIRALGATRVLVEHDGVRLARFEGMPSRSEARAALGIPAEPLVVGFVGRLHTMGMPKGLDTLVEAVAGATQTGATVHLVLVGGPEEGVEAVRAQWARLGLPPERLHTPGQVSPGTVPRYLAAMDVGTLPSPWTEHFAYLTSALKLFEYMAAGCAVLASDLPGVAEVITDGVTGFLAPPGDAAAFAAAIRRLATDRALCARLGATGQETVQHYAWSARAARIRAFVEGT